MKIRNGLFVQRWYFIDNLKNRFFWKNFKNSQENITGGVTFLYDDFFYLYARIVDNEQVYCAKNEVPIHPFSCVFRGFTWKHWPEMD